MKPDDKNCRYLPFVKVIRIEQKKSYALANKVFFQRSFHFCINTSRDIAQKFNFSHTLFDKFYTFEKIFQTILLLLRAATVPTATTSKSFSER